MSILIRKLDFLSKTTSPSVLADIVALLLLSRLRLGIDRKILAEAIGGPTDHLGPFSDGDGMLTPETAARIERKFQFPPELISQWAECSVDEFIRIFRSWTDPALAAIRLVAEADTDNFVELIKLARLDPSEHLCFANWEGVDFSDCDLRGFNFTASSLKECKFRGALIEGARFDRALTDGAHSSRSRRLGRACGGMAGLRSETWRSSSSAGRRRLP